MCFDNFLFNGFYSIQVKFFLFFSRLKSLNKINGAYIKIVQVVKENKMENYEHLEKQMEKIMKDHHDLMEEHKQIMKDHEKLMKLLEKEPR